MKTLLFFITLGLAFTQLAQAKTVKLVGEPADGFVSKNFPNADLPGTAQGFFTYTHKDGSTRTAYAHCFNSKMAPHAPSAQTTCLIEYHVTQISGKSAESFITKHFPDSSIPGTVKGGFKYKKYFFRKSSTGHAECFYPSMGARSEGSETTCTVAY